MENLPLSGIRITDFTWILAGPYATRIMADFGAEVIKIQTRKLARDIEAEDSHYFASWNRNKLGITLDMHYPEGRDLALKLISVSDVVIQNFTPRVMENWNLTYDSLKKVKPDIIVVNLSAMGAKGPWRDYAALADTIEALSGLSYLTAQGENSPSIVGYPHSDIVAGLFASIAILSALECRKNTGKGQYMDISELEATCALLGPAILDYTINNNIPLPQGNRTDYLQAAPYGCYKCQGEDRWCVIAIYTEKQWHSFCRIMGNPGWIKQQKFSTLSRRKNHIEELDENIQKWTIDKTPDQIKRLLHKTDITCSIVNNARDVENDPQLRHRNFFINSEHPLLGSIKMEGTPLKLSDAPLSIRRPAPILGQDNEYVFKNLLGLNEKLIAHYIKDGIIG